MQKRYVRVFLLCVAQAANFTGATDHWTYLGNQTESRVDSETGETVLYLTEGEGLENHFHYHGDSWGVVNGELFLFFESTSGSPRIAEREELGRRFIMAAKVPGGGLYRITDIPNAELGKSKWETRPYRTAFDADRKALVFVDESRRSFYAHDCVLGRTIKLYSLPKGHASRHHSVRTLGGIMRVVFPYSRSTDLVNEHGDGIFCLDFDSEYNLLSERVLHVGVPGEAFNHVSIHPVDGDLYFYKSHRPMSDPSQGKLVTLHLDRVSGRKVRHCPSQYPDKIDHMVWGDSGRYIYWDDNGGNMIRYDTRNGKTETIGRSGAIHNQLNPNEVRWVYDLRKPISAEKVTHQNSSVKWVGGIYLFDMRTNEHRKLTNIIWGDPHPRHPHATFSPEGRYVSFTEGTPSGGSRVAIIEID